jgi:hypothetical protein
MDPELNTQPEKRYSKTGIWMAIGLTIGAGIGMVYGYAIDNFTLGLVLGAGGGLLIGLSLGTAVANHK